MTNEEKVEIMFDRLDREDVSTEEKVFSLIHLLYDGDISLCRAKELCEEIGLFNDHWLVVEERVQNAIYDEYGKLEKN